MREKGQRAFWSTRNWSFVDYDLGSQLFSKEYKMNEDELENNALIKPSVVISKESKLQKVLVERNI